MESDHSPVKASKAKDEDSQSVDVDGAVAVSVSSKVASLASGDSRYTKTEKGLELLLREFLPALSVTVANGTVKDAVATGNTFTAAAPSVKASCEESTVTLPTAASGAAAGTGFTLISTMAVPKLPASSVAVTTNEMGARKGGAAVTVPTRFATPSRPAVKVSPYAELGDAIVRRSFSDVVTKSKKRDVGRMNVTGELTVEATTYRPPTGANESMTAFVCAAGATAKPPVTVATPTPGTLNSTSVPLDSIDGGTLRVHV
jgi:hypothetical protein